MSLETNIVLDQTMPGKGVQKDGGKFELISAADARAKVTAKRDKDATIQRSKHLATDEVLRWIFNLNDAIKRAAENGDTTFKYEMIVGLPDPEGGEYYVTTYNGEVIRQLHSILRERGYRSGFISIHHPMALEEFEVFDLCRDDVRIGDTNAPSVTVDLVLYED